MSYIYVENRDALDELIASIVTEPSNLFCDIETTGLDWSENKILLFQIMHYDKIYIVDVRGLGKPRLTELVEAIQNSGSTCVFHNAKFDMKFIAWNSGIVLERVYDTMVFEVILTAGIGKSYYSLVSLAEKYAGVFMEKESRSEFIDFPDDKPFTENMLNYSALDVKVLKPILEAQLEQAHLTFQRKVFEIESELLPVVTEMELTGIGLDIESWLKVEKKAIRKRDKLNNVLKQRIISLLLSQEVSNGLELANLAQIPVHTKRLTKFLEEITELSTMRGWLMDNFNTKSPLQMKKVLNLSGIEVNDTNEKTLSDFKQNKLVRVLLKIREVNKQIDAYGSNMLTHIKPATGKIHTEYSTVGTQTGRFSSRNPNLQQVPTLGGYRECFIPDEGFVFISVDYSQQEYRLAGAISKDPVIIKAYQEGSDMHTSTGKIVSGKEKISKEERHRGKTVNFAILYGSTEYGLKHNLNINIQEAKEIINKFWAGYKNLSKFMEMAGKKILELGFSSTPMGRRRYNAVKPLYGNSFEFMKWQEKVLREGKNHIIQGGGADILKLAMIRIRRENPFGNKLKLILQIHDEVLVMVHESIKEEAGLFVRDMMEQEEQKFLGAIPAKADGWNEFKNRWSK